MVTDNAALRLEVEASLAKFEAAMDRARRNGIRTVTDLDRRWDRATRGMGQSAARAQNGITGVLNVSRQGRFVLQNTAAQFGDIAVQLEQGTNPMRVMGQQLPQILGGFGALSGVLGVLAPLLGTVAAVGFPLAAMFILTGDSVEDASEKVKTFEERLELARAAVDRAREAMARAGQGGVADLAEIYGEVTARVRELADELALIEARAARVEVSAILSEALGPDFQNQISDLLGTVGQAVASAGTESAAGAAEQIKAQIKSLEGEISLIAATGADTTVQQNQVAELRQELAAVLGDLEGMGSLVDELTVSPETLDSISEMQRRLEAAKNAMDFQTVFETALRLRQILVDAGIEVEQGVLDGLTRTADIAKRADATLGSAKVNAEGVAAGARNIVDPLTSAANEAGRLADNLASAIGLTGEIGRRAAVAGVRDGSIPGAALDDLRDENVDRALEDRRRRSRATDRRSVTRSGRGAAVAQPDLFAASQARVVALQREIEVIGKSRSEIAELQTRWQILDAAKKAGVPITDELTARIDAEAEAVGRLTQRQEDAQTSMQAMQQFQGEWKDAMLDTLSGAEDGFDRLAKSIKRAALEYLAFGSGSFAGTFGGNFKGLFGSFAGFFDGGGNIPTGQFGIAAEKRDELVNGILVRGPAKVTSGSETSRMIGGNRAVYNIDARGAQMGVADQIVRAIQEATPGIQARATQQTIKYMSETTEGWAT